jgi:hypothetical protein
MSATFVLHRGRPPAEKRSKYVLNCDKEAIAWHPMEPPIELEQHPQVDTVLNV